MKAYIESGKRAAQRLAARCTQRSERHCLARLRGFKQFINLCCFSAIVMIPTVGVLADSAAMAAVVALGSLLFIWLLELAERRVKRELMQIRQQA
ncbi:MAG: hypothetical protein IT464_11285 [Planctomycetes bacterium]|nr:hypothetical protein [Planctomycetota bacterium]